MDPIDLVIGIAFGAAAYHAYQRYKVRAPDSNDVIRVAAHEIGHLLVAMRAPMAEYLGILPTRAIIYGAKRLWVGGQVEFKNDCLALRYKIEDMFPDDHRPKAATLTLARVHWEKIAIDLAGYAGECVVNQEGAAPYASRDKGSPEADLWRAIHKARVIAKMAQGIPACAKNPWSTEYWAMPESLKAELKMESRVVQRIIQKSFERASDIIDAQEVEFRKATQELARWGSLSLWSAQRIFGKHQVGTTAATLPCVIVRHGADRDAEGNKDIDYEVIFPATAKDRQKKKRRNRRH